MGRAGGLAALAIVEYKLGNYEAAQDLYARAYEIQCSTLGPEHAEVAGTMNSIAGLLKTMGKVKDAELVYRTVGAHSCAIWQLPIALTSASS